MSEQYTYAVARIRALEVSLFSDSTIDQLIACQSYDQALQFLEEKGWGDTESSGDAEKILTREEEKTWEVVKDLSIGMEHFDVLSYPKLFNCSERWRLEWLTEWVLLHRFCIRVRLWSQMFRENLRIHLCHCRIICICW